MRFLFLLSLILLSSCAGVPASESETKLVGYTLPDILSCAGKPDQSVAINHDDVIIEYEQNTPVQPNFNIGGIYGVSLGLGGIGTCKMVVRVHDGYVGSIHYTGPSWTVAGLKSACTPMIKSCYSRSDHTQLDKDYDQFAILGVTRP